jgi:hypothetical protein
MHDDAEKAKKLILDCYSIEYLHRAFTLRTQDVMFGNIGSMISKRIESPTAAIWLGYQFLVDSMHRDL